MVDLSGLINALAQDDIDQRVVAEHLVLLLKALKNSTPHVPTAEAASTPTQRFSPQNPAKVTKAPSTDVQQHLTKGDPIEAPIIPVQLSGDVWEASVEDKKQKNRHEGEREEQSQEPLRAQQVQQDREDNEGDESMETRRVSNEGGVKRKPKVKVQLQMGLLQELLRSFRGGMLRVNSNLRADMFRAVRYLVRTSEDAEVVRRQRFDLFIALSLSRDNTKLWERMQALKLMKQIMSVDSTKLPREAIRMVVAVSGHKEDNFRRVCLETLCELAVANPRMVAHANGFQVFLSASIDPDIQDIADLLMTTLMSVLEDPSTRQFVRPHLELHQLLSGFTDLDYPAGPERAHLWQSTRKVLVVVMRNWAGVHLLASDSRGLVALMRLLRDQSAFGHEAELQNIILDTINDIFAPFTGMGKTPSTDKAQNPRELSSSERSFPFYDPGSAARSSLWMKKGPEPHKMLSYATILCVAFVHCGLIPSLTTLSISAGSENLREKAANMLEGFLRLCGMLLSQNQCTRLLAMPGLVQIAAESETGSMAAARGGAKFCHLMRSRASRASDLIHRLHGALGTGSFVLMSCHSGLQNQNDLSLVTIGEIFHKVYDADRAYHNLETLRRAGWEHSETLEQMRKDLRLSIESSVEKRVMDRQMSESKVLSIKDWTKWDWDVVDDIVQDTLPHPPRLADALRTKWIKRVSGFYRFRGADNSGVSTGRAVNGLHNIRWDPDHIRHIGCAGRLYSLLLQHPEGVHFLQTEPRGSLIQEIVKELEALVARRRNSGSGGSGSSSKVFNMESCQRYLSAGYLTLLFSVAAAYDAGRDLLADGGLWNHLTAMGSQPELDYLSRVVLVKISLSDKPIPRKLLKAWLSTGSSQLRLFVVNLLRSVLKKISTGDSDYSSTSRTGNMNLEDPTRPEEWYVEGLVGQLNSDDPSVAGAALSVLEETTQDERCLRSLVHQLLAKPELINIPGASNLFMRCLSVPEGIQYLENVGWVERIVREWRMNGSTTGYSWIIDETWKAHVNGVGRDEDSREPEAIRGRGSTSRIKEKVIPIKTNNISIQHFMSEGTGRGGPWDGLEMQLLMSLPWNIEVMLSRDAVPTGGVQLRLDTWVDASPQERSRSSKMPKKATSAQSATTMVVRGTVVDSNGTPACHLLEADVTLHARLCIGTCPVDRKGNVQWYPNSSTDKQTAPFGRTRTNRTMRSPRSPQHGRADYSMAAYGSVTVYRGLQDLSPVDDSSAKYQEIWSTCKPHQRLAGGPSNNTGGESCRSGRSTLGMHAVADDLKSVHDGEDRDAPSVHSHDHGHRRGIREDSDNLGPRAPSDARIPHEGCERILRVHNETARWIFANQLDTDDDSKMMQVSDNTYLKAVEMTIYLQDVGPSPTLPPHLYGELAKTERGCELLRAHADLRSLLHVARNPTAPANDRKGALWAVAHVSSWPLGLTLLEQIQDDVVSMLLSLCTAESHLSVWGTSFCVVSLIARTARGRAAIKAAGWESARDPSTSIFLPQDPTILFQPVPWTFEGSVTQGLEEQPSDPIIDRLRQDLPANEAEVVNHVAKLSSHISRKDAMKKLNRMRRDKAHRDCFTRSLPVFLLVHQLLADYSFSLPVRRYILELFEQVAPGVSDWEPYIV